MTREEALAASPRVTFNTPQLIGSIALKGARIDDVRLAKHREELDPNSPPVPVLSPVGGDHPYYAEFGWTSSDAGVKVPGPDSLWTASSTTLAPDKPVRLTWDNGAGLIFAPRHLDRRELHVRGQAERREQDRQAGDALPLGLVVRKGERKNEGTYVLHEGPYGVFNGSLKEFSYKDFNDNKQRIWTTTGGWVGITDKYWMATLDPRPEEQGRRHVAGHRCGRQHQVPDRLCRGRRVTVAPGAIGQLPTSHLFAGAKIVHVIDAYRDRASASTAST